MHSDYDFYDPGSGLHNSHRCESGGPQIAGQTGEMMEIRQLEYFRAIVDAGTISGAARELHMTQPPLSYQMKMLEEELQVPLFIRGMKHHTDGGRKNALRTGGKDPDALGGNEA